MDLTFTSDVPLEHAGLHFILGRPYASVNFNVICQVFHAVYKYSPRWQCGVASIFIGIEANLNLHNQKAKIDLG